MKKSHMGGGNKGNKSVSGTYPHTVKKPASMVGTGGGGGKKGMKGKASKY